jgi:hypothetical protein
MARNATKGYPFGFWTNGHGPDTGFDLVAPPRHTWVEDRGGHYDMSSLKKRVRPIADDVSGYLGKESLTSAYTEFRKKWPEEGEIWKPIVAKQKRVSIPKKKAALSMVDHTPTKVTKPYVPQHIPYDKAMWRDIIPVSTALAWLDGSVGNFYYNPDLLDKSFPGYEDQLIRCLKNRIELQKKVLMALELNNSTITVE